VSEMTDGMTFISNRAAGWTESAAVNGGSADGDEEVDGMDERIIDLIIARRLEPVFDRLRSMTEEQREEAKARQALAERLRDVALSSERALKHAHDAVGEATAAKLDLGVVSERLVGVQGRLSEVRGGADQDAVREIKEQIRALEKATTRLATQRESDADRAGRHADAIEARVKLTDHIATLTRLEDSIRERSTLSEARRQEARLDKIEAGMKRQMWWIVGCLFTICVLLLGVIAKG